MTQLTRVPDWRTRFEVVADDMNRKPFSWADQHDCGIGLVGNLVLAMTGVDVIAPFRGTYRSREGAYAVMRKAGFEDLADMAAHYLPEIRGEDGAPWVAGAGVGDIAAFPMDSEFRHALGVVNGERVLVLRPEGFGTMGLLDAVRAFRVG